MERPNLYGVYRFVSFHGKGSQILFLGQAFFSVRLRKIIETQKEKVHYDVSFHFYFHFMQKKSTTYANFLKKTAKMTLKF